MLEEMSVPRGARVLVHARQRRALVPALQHAVACEWQLILLPSAWSDAQVAAYEHEWQPCVRLEARAEGISLTRNTVPWIVREPGVVIFTSGTTGRPKPVLHSFERLYYSAALAAERLQGRTWYLTYEPASFAGLQVCLAALASASHLVIPDHGGAFANHAKRLVEEHVDVVSATPTWWRLLLASWPAELSKPKLHQITLGGERVDQAILDLLEQTFAPQHLTHIYASSEVGTAIVVSDRLEGFPASYLEPGRRTELRIDQGVLVVKSPLRMCGYLTQASTTEPSWIDTGDLVEVRGERCYFVGRKDQCVNVGGVKVAIEEVEAALLRYEELLDCVAYGKPSPITGSLLVADVVPRAPQCFDVSAFTIRLKRELPNHLAPQRLRVVSQLAVSANGKKQRIRA